ncbi:MAG TPA: polysaccharide biosynthesis/export family protein [Acetobacteraceae bacterium]
MRVFLCLLLLLLFGCAPGRGLPPIPPGSSEYRLGAGDSVRLTVFGEDQLTGEYRVGDSGSIAVPLLGEVRAAGLTPVALQRLVTAALTRDKLLRDPSVVAEVTAYRPIFVLGEVNKPGEFPYQPGMTVVTAAAVAGGFTYRAVQSYASVVRTIDGHAVEGKATRQTYLQPGDVITVYERWF